MSSVGPDGAILDDDGKPTGLRVKRNFAVNTPGEVGAAAKGFTNAGLKAEGGALDKGYTGAASAVTHPVETGSLIKMLIQKNAGPLAAQTGGGLTGAEIGGGIGEAIWPLGGGVPGAIIGGALGAGGANVAAMKTLPKEYGGDPEATKLNDFMWGAAPEGIGRAVPAGVGRILAKKLAKGALETGTEFEKTAQDVAKSTREQIATGLQGPDVTAANIRQVGQALGSPTGYKLAAPEGAARTAAANQAQAHVLGPIDRQREKLGAPIGAAYDALKGKPPLSPQDAQDLADAASGIQSSLLSPAPKAQAVLKKVQDFAPTAAPVTPGGGWLPNQDVGNGQRFVAHSQNPGKILVQGKGGIVSEIADPSLGGGMPSGNLPTPDELRVLRQGLGKSLANAEGGDAHAIKELRQAIDQHLMPLLPPGIKAQHAEYHNFLQNYPWRSVNQLRKIGDPEGIGDWMFSKSRPASVINESIRNATPEEREGYKEMLAQRVLKNVDAAAEPTANRKVLRAQLAPLRRDGTLRALYGSQSEAMMNNFVHLPERRLAAAKSLSSPQGQKLYLDGFMAEAKRSGKAGHKAAEAGFQAWYDALPPERQAILRQNTPQLTLPKQTPQLPSPQQTLADQLRPAATLKMGIPKFVLYSGIGGALTSGALSGYTGHYALGFGLAAVTTAGINSALRIGGAEAIAKMYASPTGRAAGAAAFRALAQMGGRAMHNAAQQSDDQDAEP